MRLEFHLVAGGEELFTENGLLASPKAQDGSEAHDRMPSLDGREALSSSSASTPDYILTEFMPHASPSPQYAPSRSPVHALGPLDVGGAFEPYPSASSTIAVAQRTPPPSPPCNRINSPVKLEPLHMGSGLYALPASPLSGFIPGADTSPIFPMMPPPVPNQLVSLCLWAEGMSMFVADVERIAAAMPMPAMPPPDGPPTVLLRIKLHIAAADDIYSSPNLHGFHGVVTFANRWATQAQCSTAVYAGRACVSQEAGLLDGLQTGHVHQVDGLTPQSVSFSLPESSLSRCRWLQNGMYTPT